MGWLVTVHASFDFLCDFPNTKFSGFVKPPSIPPSGHHIDTISLTAYNQSYGTYLAMAAPEPLATSPPLDESIESKQHLGSNGSLESAWDIFHETPVPTVVLTPMLFVHDVSESFCENSGLHRKRLLGSHLNAICAMTTLPSFKLASKSVSITLESGIPHQTEDLV